ncbi:hypothetical protein Sango_1366600 [Sesamum angolense]|uniref:Uncharacterized protein n=1 Tax=Sesamum angolense TaxID=2727404 RepID=A0AAE1WT44_9LAMI|nr:hypothetical protein Sango_1366600 [Sesamum angolense]
MRGGWSRWLVAMVFLGGGWDRRLYAVDCEVGGHGPRRGCCAASPPQRRHRTIVRPYASVSRTLPGPNVDCDSASKNFTGLDSPKNLSHCLKLNHLTSGILSFKLEHSPTSAASQVYWTSSAVLEGVTLPEDSSTSSSSEKGKLENKKAKDSEALYYIQTAVADHIFPRISVATSAKEAWSILQKEYQGSAKVRIIKLQTLRRDFEK